MSQEQKKKAKEEAGKLIVEGINDFLDQSTSPVSGGSFKKKLKDGGRSILFQEGDLRDSIISKSLDGDEIEVGVFDSEEIPIAYNQNIGDTLPQRQFIPDEDQNFKGKIMKRVEQRISEIRSESPSTLTPLRTTTIGTLFNQFSDATIQSEPQGSSINLTIAQLLRIANGEG